MAEAEQAITYIFKWHTIIDERACKICLALDGREWYNQDPFRQPTLQDFFYGDIWDLATDQPLTHPNCRCKLEMQVHVDVSPWQQKLQDLIHRVDC